MSHFIRFAAGVITGIAAMQLIKSKSTKTALENAQGRLRDAASGINTSPFTDKLEKAQEVLRDATVSSLQAIENASARARAQLASDSAEITEESHSVIEPAAETQEKIGGSEEAS
ncbi:hypothetical protein [Methylobacter sp.]|uniref:hypothetical protein n=1 Tax=Methylobacter sp. TaxID=2051955 RepID=UPI002FDE16F8